MNKKLVIILLLALALRLVSINQSLWHDEAISTLAVRDYSFLGLVNDFVRVDNHPPLYYLTLKAWSSIFGYSEIALRLLSVGFGVLSVLFTYKIAELLSKDSNSNLPAISSILLATSSLHTYYSQEVRMYSMGMFASALVVFSFLKIRDSNASNFNWASFSLSLLVLSMTDYVLLMLVPALWFFALVKARDKEWWKKFLFSHALIIIFAFSWFSVFIDQYKDDQLLLASLPNWQNIAGGATPRQLVVFWAKLVGGRISYFNKIYYAVVIAVFSIPFIVALANSFRFAKKNMLMWMWFVIPVLIGFGASFFIPVFIYFRFIFVIPAFYILVSVGVEKSKKNSAHLLIVLFTVNILGWKMYAFNKNQHREDWRGSATLVEENVGPNEFALFNYTQVPAGYRWYGNSDSLAVVGNDLIDTQLEGLNGVYYFDYLSDLTDPEKLLVRRLEELDYQQTKIYNFRGVGQVRYFVLHSRIQ